MIYTVTFNPSLDYVVTVKDFTVGMVNRTADESLFPGGKGINVSMVLKNLGHESIALGFTAGFTGDEIVRRLEQKGVCADFIRIGEGNSRINVKLRAGQETEINGQGPEILPEDVSALHQKLDTMEDGDILVLAGSIPDVMPRSAYRDICEHLKGRDIRIVVDATRDLLINVLPYRPFLIKPNHHELGEIFGVTLHEKRQVAEYARKLQEQGARNVLVSMAGEGAVLAAENGQVYEAPAPAGKVVNSVGAGDSMVAGFLAGFLESGDYHSAFVWGLGTGSASAFSDELATREEAEALFSQITVEHAETVGNTGKR